MVPPLVMQEQKSKWEAFRFGIFCRESELHRRANALIGKSN
jgi:hypothetical protein